jgi:hypothetical protein
MSETRIGGTWSAKYRAELEQRYVDEHARRLAVEALAERMAEALETAATWLEAGQSPDLVASGIRVAIRAYRSATKGTET